MTHPQHGSGEPDASEMIASFADAAERDLQADLRDAEAQVRDGTAAKRDDRAAAADDAHRRPGPTRANDRDGAGDDRSRAEDDRTASSEDRAAAAADRDRAGVLIDNLMHDVLTGFYQRGPGLIELEREVLKCQRTGEVFTVAFVDIDGLKATNDEEGHAAGDRLIAEVAEAVHSVLREYDVVMRYGGDEFVCGMQGLREAEAKARFAELKQGLSKGGGPAASVGIAELRAGESLQTLISRADTAMYEEKMGRPGHR